MNTTIPSNFTLLFTNEILSNIKVFMDEETVRYQINLHGFSRKQAYFIITTVIKLTRENFTLDLIHGFNHGTVLKSMILENIQNTRIINKYCNPWNPGETFIELTAVW